MSGYRFAWQCKECKRVVRDHYEFHIYGNVVCKKCGSLQWEECIAKPKLFGIRGWTVKKIMNEDKEEE